MKNKFEIPGNLPSLNEYTKVNRSNKFGGNKLKQQTEDMLMWCICKADLKPCERPIKLKVIWYEKDLKRDADNVIFAKKFILDSLVKCGVLENDSRKFVIGFEDIVLVDRTDPRIEVEIIEME